MASLRIKFPFHMCSELELREHNMRAAVAAQEIDWPEMLHKCLIDLGFPSDDRQRGEKLRRDHTMRSQRGKHLPDYEPDLGIDSRAPRRVGDRGTARAQHFEPADRDFARAHRSARPDAIAIGKLDAAAALGHPPDLDPDLDSVRGPGPAWNRYPGVGSDRLRPASGSVRRRRTHTSGAPLPDEPSRARSEARTGGTLLANETSA